MYLTNILGCIHTEFLAIAMQKFTLGSIEILSENCDFCMANAQCERHLTPSLINCTENKINLSNMEREYKL